MTNMAEKIAEDLEEPLENIQSLVSVAEKYAPEYDEASILKEILKADRHV